MPSLRNRHSRRVDLALCVSLGLTNQPLCAPLSSTALVTGGLSVTQTVDWHKVQPVVICPVRVCQKPSRQNQLERKRTFVPSSFFHVYHLKKDCKVACLCKMYLLLFSHCMDHFLTSDLALQVVEYFHMEVGTGPNSRHATHNSGWEIGKDFPLYAATVLPSGLLLDNRYSVWCLGFF